LIDQNKAIVPVPLGIDILESLPFDDKRKLNADILKKLMDVLNKKLSENHDALKQVICDVKDKVLREERERAGLERFVKEIDELNAQVTSIQEKIEVVKLRCQNTTGFDLDGELLPDSDPHQYGYGRGDDAQKLWRSKRHGGIKKSKAIRDRINTAVKFYERYFTKFDKIQTRLLLASTYGEARIILGAVLGNGDEILSVTLPTDDTKD